MTNYGKARDPEWIEEVIASLEKIAACVTDVLANDIMIGKIEQGRHEPMAEVAAGAIVSSLMIHFGLDKLDLVRDEVWPQWVARTYTLYDAALTESRKFHNGTDT